MGGTGSGRKARERQFTQTQDGQLAEIVPLGGRAPGGSGAPAALFGDTVAKLDEALRYQEQMGGTAWVRAAFSVADVEHVYVFRVLPNAQESRVAVWNRSTVNVEPGSEEDITARCLDSYGPGTYVLRPYKDDTWISKKFSKKVVAGFSDKSDGGIERGTLEEADAALAGAAKREAAVHAVSTLQSLNRRLAGTEEAQEMKPGEMVEVLKSLMALRATDSGATEVLAVRLESLERRLVEALAPRDSEMTKIITTLLPALAPLLGQFKPRTIMSLIGNYLRPPAEEAAAPTLIEQVGPLLEKVLPLFQPFVEQLAARGISASGAPAAATTAPAALPAPGGPIMQQSFTDPDTIETLNYVVNALDQERFQDAWAALRNCADTLPWLQTVEPGVDQLPLYFGMRTLDPRLRTPVLRDKAIRCIAYMQEKIAEWQRSQEEGDEPELEPETPVEKGRLSSVKS